MASSNADANPLSSQGNPMQRKQDDANLVLAAVAIAFLLTLLNTGEAVLQTAATPFVAPFFPFLFLFRYARH